MYIIDSKVDKPDTNYLLDNVKGMMKRGIKVGNLNKIYSDCEERKNSYLSLIRSKYEIDNPNSSAQVIAYMDSLNDPKVVEVCCEKGKWTSNKQALARLETMGYEFASDIIAYRTAKKYGDSIKSMMDCKDQNSRIHPLVSLTKTNRISYSNPALMNIPKELLWDTVIPSEPGDVLISADIKNQEPNILINMNDVKSLKPALESDMGLYEAIFNQIPIYCRMNLIICEDEPVGIMDNDAMRGRDDIPPVFYEPKRCPMSCVEINGEVVEWINVINLVMRPGQIPELPSMAEVATESGNVYDVPCRFSLDNLKAADKKKLNSFGVVEVDGVIEGLTLNCTGEYRKEFKRAWNAMTYGASSLGVKEMCKAIDGNLVYNFFSKIPELAEYRKFCTKLANDGQQHIKTYFGTLLTADEYNSKALKRVLLDLPIQGTAADILSLLVKHFNNSVKSMGIEGELSIYYTRHDELIIEAKKSLVDRLGIDKIVEIIKDLTIHKVDDWTPFKVDVKVIETVSISDIIKNSSEEA